MHFKNALIYNFLCSLTTQVNETTSMSDAIFGETKMYVLRSGSFKFCSRTNHVLYSFEVRAVSFDNTNQTSVRLNVYVP